MCSKICGSIVLFCKLLKQTSAFKHENTTMPKKGERAKAVHGSPAQDTEGGRSQPDSTISGDAGPLSSPHGASLESDSSVSPQKNVRAGRLNSRHREVAAATEGASWQGQEVAPALARRNAGRSTKADAAPTGLSEVTFAQVSAGRVEAVKRALPMGTGHSATRATASSVKAPQKAAPAPSQHVALLPGGAGAAPSLSCDQQTQDVAGQEAAPPMLFQVNVGMCDVCASCQICILLLWRADMSACFGGCCVKAVLAVRRERLCHAHQRRGSDNAVWRQHSEHGGSSDALAHLCANTCTHTRTEMASYTIYNYQSRIES